MTLFPAIRPLAGAAAVLGLALIGGAALAQNATPPKEDSTIGGVTVTAPKVIEQNRDGVTSSVLTMSVHVPYGDLNLHTPEGVAELNARVQKAAEYVCTRLSSQYPNGYPDDIGCEKDAVSNAGPQIVKAKL
jgi:UrcA family protein